jgi:hypothetical protein
VKHVKIFLKIGLILALCLLCVPASAAIARGSAEFTDYQTQYITGVNGYLSIPKPTAVVAGNFMIAQISYDNGTGETITPPPGWTLVRRTDHDTPYGPYGQAIYYKVATSSEGSFSPYGWTFRPWTLDAYGGITRYTGVHPIFPIVTSSGATGWVQQTPPASKLNMIGSGVTAEANSRLVGLYGLQQNRAFGNPPGMTGIYAKAKAFTGSNNGLAIHTFDQAIPTAGATGDKVAVASSIYTYDAYIAQLVDLRDATTAVHGISFATSGLPPSTDVSVTYSGTDPSGNALNGPIIVSSNRPSSTIFTQPNTQFTFSFPTIAGYGVPSTSTASPYTTGSDGATTTITATYPVACTPPSISTQPTAHAACVGSSTSFSVVATGTGPLSYQWYHGETAVGPNSNSLTIPTVAAGDAGEYHVVVTNGCGSATSNPATLTVNTPPSISTQPTAQAACVGCSATFSVVATGSGTLSYQWYHGSNAVGTGNTLTINPVGPSDAGSYTVVVSSSTGCTAATSNPATLTVNTPPVITGQPVTVTKYFGDPVTFSFTATGTTPFSYQWKKDGVDITDAHSASYTINHVTFDDAGSYTVVVTNGCGSATSNPAILTVKPAPTTSTVTVSRSPQQYSDLVTLTVTISPSSILGQVPATGANIYVGTQLMGTVDLTEETPGSGILTGSLADVALLEPVPYGTAPTGQMAPGSHTVKAEFTDTNPKYFVVTNPTTPLTITKENAIVTYTGPLFVGSSSTGAATITMTATVQDDADGSRGDIRNAVVKFYNGVTFIGQAPVGLVNPSDTTTGTAVYQWSVNIGNSDSETYVVSASANNYYTGSDTTDITVSKALADNFITGGGYIVLSNSAGSTPGTRGTKNNFGFSVKYNKKLTNLQGHSNVIVRDRGHVYQVKSNAISSLTVNTVTGAAVLTSKATLQDVTDSLNPVPIAGNYVLVLSMTDRGEPGSTDSIAISVLDKSGGTWFSSNWNGVTTIEQTLDGGNLLIH